MSRNELIRAIDEQKAGIYMLENTIFPEDKKEEMVVNANVAIEAMTYYLNNVLVEKDFI